MKRSARTFDGIIAAFPRSSVLVAGDVMLDRFLLGDVHRINPEAPVPILRVTGEKLAPGGASNAAANVASLGGRTCIAGYVGGDAAGRKLQALVRGYGIRTAFVPCARPTITKVRAVARGQQLLRLDYEDDRAVSRRLEEKLLAAIKGLGRRFDAVLISDYGKGVVTERLVELCTGLAPVVTVDPVPPHRELYRGVTLLTPNTKEAAELLGADIRTDADLARAGAELVRRLDAHVLVTRGERGMTLFRRGGGRLHLPTVAQEVIDVTGAGDTVIAAATLALAAGAPLEQALVLSNLAAGLVVSKSGTATVSPEELRAAARRA
ncbi:MAG TPA: D-glycero-beta-D-manno-heptose-7-phosphate kinase [Planctomycetes bacterium]|nr:D-glycero-beta-D-manno-heptose-7-phosphate kinase [Planctomycetota bacterium]